MNFDQTPVKYAAVQSRTLDIRGTSHVAIAGSAYKQAITATFGITFSNGLFPMQLIYGGKTERSIPKFQFPKSFALSANPKHFSNTDETLKLTDDIILPYIQHERANLQLRDDHPALLILDVFSGQMTRIVLDKLQENNIHLVRVPPNMTNLFQPPDLTVNGAAKAYMKRRFTEWYSKEIWKELEAGKDLDDIDIKLTLTILKPLHARWLGDLYDYLTSSKGQRQYPMVGRLRV